MKISKSKKYISWNIISLIGYIGTVFFIIFSVIKMIGASTMNMRADLNEYYAEYLMKHIISPYYAVYKFQLFLILMLLIGSVCEHRHYNENNLEGFQPFETLKVKKIYSMIFYTGLLLNFVPLYIPFLNIISFLIKFCGIIMNA